MSIHCIIRHRFAPPAAFVAIALSTFASLCSAQNIVGPNNTESHEQRFAGAASSSFFAEDWSALDNEIFFGGADVLFGLTPAALPRRSFTFSSVESSTTTARGGAANSAPNESWFSSALSSSATFARGNGSAYPVSVPNAPNAPLATKTWNNLGTDFNDDASWSGGKPGLNDIATFTLPKGTDPVATNTSTQTILGLSFETGGFGYTLSSVPNAILGIGTGGISAENATGANTITASLLLNFDQSITQSTGGTLNVTGPVILGPGSGTTTLTIGSTSNNGTINFSPSSVAIGNTIHFVTNVDVTLPAITLSPAPPFVAGITKSGAGTLTLTAGGNYNGTTTLTAGTLLITNPSGSSATGSGAVIVNNSGTLAGNGYIDAGSNTITISGTLSPGPVAAVGNPGTINLASTAGTGALTLSSNSTILFDITNTATKDLIALTNTGVVLSGGALALTLGPSFDYTQQYAIFTGVQGLSGGFGNVTGFDSANWAPVFTLNGSEYDLTFVPVPEPSTWVGAVLGVAAIGFTQRRRFSRGGPKSPA